MGVVMSLSDIGRLFLLRDIESLVIGDRKPEAGDRIVDSGLQPSVFDCLMIMFVQLFQDKRMIADQIQKRLIFV